MPFRSTRPSLRLLALAALVGTSTAAIAAPAKKPSFDVARVSNDIKTLSSDEYEGRGPATRAETKTIEYIAAQFKAAGLKPAGDKGSFFQDVPLLKSDIVGTPSLAMAIGGANKPLTQGSEIAVRAASTGQTSVQLNAAPLVFVGYGVKAPERNWDDFKGIDLKGKIMVVLVNDPDFEAAKAAARKANFRPMPLKATMTASYQVKPEIITSHNVAGILPGSRHPDETVIYSAHWDHLGIGAPDATGDTIYNGALDNASGTAALMELARAYGKGPKPDRSILFLAVTAEEKGLLGSEYYADNPLRPLATTVGAINMDGPFAVEKTTDFSISGAAKLDLLTMLTEEAAKFGRHYTAEARPEAGSFYRSDHFPFAKRGVPAISYDAGQELVNGGAARGKELSDLYTRDRYHQPADEYDASWNTSSWEGDLTLLYNLGDRLANGRVWPNWSADSEFRATREETASQRK